MARTEIPVYAINREGFFPEDDVLGDPTNGMYFAENSGETFLEIENPGTLNIVVGANIYDNAIDGITIGRKEIVAAAGSTVKFGPYPMSYYNQDDASVYIDIDPDGDYGVEGTQLLLRAFDFGN